MDHTDADATVYDLLRERGVLLAWSWAVAEWCRIVFATAAFCGPGVILVFLVFEAGKQSAGHVARLFTEWQLYVSLIVAGAVPFVLWRAAEWVTGWIVRTLPQFSESPPSQ